LQSEKLRSDPKFLYRLMFGSLSLAGGYMRFGPPQLRALPVPGASEAEKKEVSDLVLRCGREAEDMDELQERVEELARQLYLRQ